MEQRKCDLREDYIVKEKSKGKWSLGQALKAFLGSDGQVHTCSTQNKFYYF